MTGMRTWDEAKCRRNLKDRGIDVADLNAFFSGDLLTREDLRDAYGEPRLPEYRNVQRCRLIRGLTPRGEDGDMPHLISARKAENHETKI